MSPRSLQNGIRAAWTLIEGPRLKDGTEPVTRSGVRTVKTAFVKNDLITGRRKPPIGENSEPRAPGSSLRMGSPSDTPQTKCSLSGLETNTPSRSRQIAPNRAPWHGTRSRAPHRSARATTSGSTPHMSIMKVPNPLPASFFRGGTSKGVYINRTHLPASQLLWDPIFLRIMGSPDPIHARQLNGMGGGVSSLSKICVVGPPSKELRSRFPGLDVTYTFAQVGIRNSVVDYSGNCGNLSTMIGVFALDDGICKPKDSSLRTDPGTGAMTTTIRSFNENTSKLIDTTFPVRWKDQTKSWIPVLDLDQASLAGVPGRASQIVLDFVSPGGAGTGKLLPTGNAVDTLRIDTSSRAGLSIRVSLVDATNPTVFITSQDLREVLGLPSNTPIDHSDPDVTTIVEAIRKAGAIKVGLDPSLQAQPKIAILSSPPSNTDVDIEVHAFSMGVAHKACPATLALCLGVASKIKGSLAWDLVPSSQTRDPDSLVNLKHPSGVLTVGASIDTDGTVLSAKAVGTGRRLMTGSVWW